MAKSALTYIPERDEESRQANLAYQEALSRLTQTLEARKNPTFDPVMMAMAAGFLGPTRTGSFGEALGRAAEGVGKAQEAQSAQDVEVAKAQMELAQSGLGMQRLRQKSREIAEYLQPKGGTTLTPGGNLPGGAPSGGEAPQRGGLQGIQVMEPDPTFISIQEFVARNEGTGKSLGELQAEYQDKFGKNRYITSERGVVDRATGMVSVLPGGPNVTRQIPDLGTFEMDSRTAALYDYYKQNGMAEEWMDLVSKITKRPEIKGKVKESGPSPAPVGAPPESLAVTKGAPTEKPTEEPTEKPRGRAATRAQGQDAFGAPTAPSSIKSKEELAVEEAAKTEAAKKRAGFQEEARQAALDKSGVSRENIQLADEFLAFANRPDAKEIFGLASQSTLANFVQLLAGGISTPGGPIGMGAIEDFYLNAKLNPQQREAAQRFAQLAVQMQIKMNEAVKGAVSNYEQGLFGKASINLNDLPGTIKLKADALRTRAMFDRDVAEIVRKNPNLNIEQVKDTKEYKLAESRLDERYRNLIIKNANSFQDKTFVDAAKQRKPESLGQSSPSQTPASGSLYDRFKQQQGAF
jgi:hypothetical protein